MKKKKIIIVLLVVVLLIIFHPRRLCTYKASDLGKITIFSGFYGRILEYEDEETIAHYVNNWNNTWYIPTYLPILGGSCRYQFNFYDKNGNELDEHPIVTTKTGNWHEIIIISHTCMDEIAESFSELMETEQNE